MRVEAVTGPRLGVRRRPKPSARPGDEKIDDRTGFGNNHALILDHRRFAEGMDLLELRRSEHGLRVPLITADIVGDAKFLEQPKNALRAAVLEMMDDQGHGRR